MDIITLSINEGSVDTAHMHSIDGAFSDSMCIEVGEYTGIVDDVCTLSLDKLK